MSEIKWIKLSTTMFEDEKIRLIESMPDSDSVLVIWVKLLALSGKTNAGGYIFLNEKIPYTDEMLSTLFNRPLNTIRFALQTFKNFGMIEIDENDFISISNWEKHQNVEGMEKVRQLNAERNRKYRERKKQLALNDVSVTSHDGTDIDKELDKDIDKDKKPSCPKFEICDMANAEYLLELVLKNNPSFRKPNLESWANEFRKIRKIDKRTIEQITFLIDWTQRDSFWSANIQSPIKLRKHWDSLVLKVKRNNPVKQVRNFEDEIDPETGF